MMQSTMLLLPLDLDVDDTCRGSNGLLSVGGTERSFAGAGRKPTNDICWQIGFSPRIVRPVL